MFVIENNDEIADQLDHFDENTDEIERKFERMPSRLPKINEQVVKDVATTNFSMEN